MQIMASRDHENPQPLSWAALGSYDSGWVGSQVKQGLDWDLSFYPQPGPGLLDPANGLSPGLPKRAYGHGDTK